MLDGHARRRAARPAHPHRDRSPLGSRMGRVGRQAAARQRRLLLTSRAVFPARRPGPRGGGGGRRGGGRAPPPPPPPPPPRPGAGEKTPRGGEEGETSRRP